MSAPARGRVVVVTGASAGIGRAIARCFAETGARVALLARSPEGLDAARREVEAAGGEALVLPTDVADAAAVEAAAAAVEARWGRIDVWVNNAMATIYAPVASIDLEDFRRATEVTYLGAVWGTLAALRRMRARDAGTIVQVGSALSFRSIPLQSAYCGAKAALRGFTDSVRCELIHDRSRVRMTMVHLSAFNTPQFEWARTTMPCRPKPLGPIFQPELAARAVLRAADGERRAWWVGWPAAKAILGQRVLAGYLDRRLAFEAWDGQQDEEPLPPGREDNLHAPLREDRGAHGRFDAQARATSVQWWLTSHRRALAAALAVVAVLVAALALAID